MKAIVVLILDNSFKCIEFNSYYNAKEYYDQERLKYKSAYLCEVREHNKR